MKNKFEHEINIIRHFLKDLDFYLERDEAKMLEESKEKYYELKQNMVIMVNNLREELLDTKLKYSQLAMEKGKLLKEIDILRQYMNNDNEAEADQHISKMRSK